MSILNLRHNVAKYPVLKFLVPLLLVLGLTLSGCQTSPEKAKKDALNKKTKANLRDETANNDVDFQGFVGRLRKAVTAHDLNMLASMMTTNFGYKLNPPMEGEGVFKYWDEQNLWPELEGILAEKFVKSNDDFMVAPPQFADKSLHYDGYRAGIRRANGSWKFIYFVNG
ncbi:MAG: hypothetical protein ABJB69_02865 [Spartobacteria bacterium]